MPSESPVPGPYQLDLYQLGLRTLNPLTLVGSLLPGNLTAARRY
jgi:hypothetical protein